MTEKTSQLFSGANRTRNMIIAGCGALLVLTCCCLVVAGVVVGLDPFNLNLLGRLTGKYDPILEVMPANTGMYAGIDVLQLNSDATRQLARTFGENTSETPDQEMDTLLQDLDAQLTEAVGVTFSGDILPWVGRRAGIGLTNVQFDEFGDPEQADFVFAMEIRDKDAFALFQEKFKLGIENNIGERFTQEDYQGTVIWSVAATDADNRVALAQSGNVFFLAQTAQSIKSALDAQKGDSLADTGVYDDLTADLPDGRVVTVFFDGPFMVNVLKTFPTTGANPLDPTQLDALAGWKGMSMALSVVDAGVQFDIVYSYDPAQLTEIQRQAFENIGSESQIAQRLPENTLGVVSGQGLNTFWASLKEQLATMPEGADFQESITLLETELGINFETDLFALLDGEYAVAVMPATDGMLAASGNNLGIIFLAQTNNPTALNTTLNKLNPYLAENLGLAPEPATVNGQTVYFLGDPAEGAQLLAYGVVDNHLNFASSTTVIQNTYSGGAALANASSYQTVLAAFPSGMRPIMYVDLAGLFTTIRAGLEGSSQSSFDESIKDFQPIRAFAAAAQFLSEGNMRMTMIAFIEKAE